MSAFELRQVEAHPVIVIIVPRRIPLSFVHSAEFFNGIVLSSSFCGVGGIVLA